MFVFQTRMTDADADIDQCAEDYRKCASELEQQRMMTSGLQMVLKQTEEPLKEKVATLTKSEAACRKQLQVTEQGESGVGRGWGWGEGVGAGWGRGEGVGAGWGRGNVRAGDQSCDTDEERGGVHQAAAGH